MTRALCDARLFAVAAALFAIATYVNWNLADSASRLTERPAVIAVLFN